MGEHKGSLIKLVKMNWPLKKKKRQTLKHNKSCPDRKYFFRSKVAYEFREMQCTVTT